MKITPYLLAAVIGAVLLAPVPGHSQAESETMPPQAPDPPSPQASAGTEQQSSGPTVFVYEFSAHWCPSCRKLGPLVKQTTRKYKGFAKLVPVDVDHNQDLSRRFNIAQIPTVMIFDKNGRVLNRLIGYQQGEQLDEILDHYKKQSLAAAAAVPQ